jgi:hypothetical protein
VLDVVNMCLRVIVPVNGSTVERHIFVSVTTLVLVAETNNVSYQRVSQEPRVNRILFGESRDIDRKSYLVHEPVRELLVLGYLSG